MIKNTILKFWLTGFGLGMIPFAPGTWGSLLGIPLYLLLVPFMPVVQFFILSIYLLLSILFINIYTKQKKIDNCDQKSFVCDEILGLSMCYVLINAHQPSHYLIGFILFRIFDISKPFPIYIIDQKMNNAFGVMFDDVLAGIYATFSFFILHFLFIKYGSLFI